jgi:hypothetical protein
LRISPVHHVRGTGDVVGVAEARNTASRAISAGLARALPRDALHLLLEQLGSSIAGWLNGRQHHPRRQ